MNRNKTVYLLSLLLGACCLVASRFWPSSWVTAPTTFLWLLCFWALVCRFRTKKELRLTGLVFVLGFMLKHAGMLGIGWVDSVLFALLGAAVYGAFWAAAFLSCRWNRFWGTLCLPVLYSLVYLLATLVRFPSPIRLDTMFVDLSVLIQAERIVGAAGFSFLLLWIVTLICYAWDTRKMWASLLPVGLVILMLLPGLIRPAEIGTETVKIAYSTGTYGGDFLRYEPFSYEENIACLEKAVCGAAGQGAQILIFNEETFEMEDTDETPFCARCSELSRENHIAVLVGFDLSDTDGSQQGKSENKLILFGFEGEILGEYRKSRLIPMLEGDYVSGDGTIPSLTLELDGKEVRISYLICYDSNFPAYVSRMDKDTDILFLPSWDWKQITRHHARLCRALAVQNDLVIVKPTYDGLSIAVGPDGKIFHQSSTDESGYEEIHLVDIPIRGN